MRAIQRLFHQWSVIVKFVRYCSIVKGFYYRGFFDGQCSWIFRVSRELYIKRSVRITRVSVRRSSSGFDCIQFLAEGLAAQVINISNSSQVHLTKIFLQANMLFYVFPNSLSDFTRAISTN